MARQKSITTKAKEIGIDLNKETLGSLVNRLHESQKALETCQTGGKTEKKGKSDC